MGRMKQFLLFLRGRYLMVAGAVLLLLVGYAGHSHRVGVDDSVDHHSLIAVTSCLNKADVSAYQHPWEHEPGDWNILDVQGTVVASTDAATVIITVVGDGDNWVEYYPEAAPQELVDVVSRCAGPTVKKPE